MAGKLDLLALLGRGVYQLVKGEGKWVPSDDLVMWGETNGYLGCIAYKEEVDDDSPKCFLGGGRLNVLAGVEVYQQYGAKLVVCGYGDRAPYTKKLDGPTESEVVSRVFAKLLESKNLSQPKIKIWTKEMTALAFNTLQELKNIFSLAIERKFTNIGFVTITSHLPRTMVFANHYLTSVPEFQNLQVRYFSAELVLAAADPKTYAPRVLNIFSSKAFGRNSELEAKGTAAFLAGEYKA